MSLSLADLGMGSATVTDLWTGGSLGTVTGTLSQSLPAHGSALLRLVPV